ncbi:MAG TPA: hypothetical protein PKD78_10260, partial [Saprospiraceae bacterium]|nr:hypothetical protein [Saprospiraceae bacterium]
DDGDSRLTLGRPEQKTFSFEWGKLSRTVGGFYGVSQYTKENTWLPTDSPMGLFHYEIGLPDVFQMFSQTPHLWRIAEQLPTPSLSLLYKEHKATYDPQNGLQPADFVSMLRREMKPGEQLVLTDFQTSNADLRTLKIILVPHEGLEKTPLPRATSDAEKQRFIVEHFSVSPNPATDHVLLRFSLPEAAAGTLRITNVLGQEIYSRSADFAAGDNSYPLDTRDLKAKGQFFATLDFGFGKSTLGFVVQ